MKKISILLICLTFLGGCHKSLWIEIKKNQDEIFGIQLRLRQLDTRIGDLEKNMGKVNANMIADIKIKDKDINHLKIQIETLDNWIKEIKTRDIDILKDRLERLDTTIMELRAKLENLKKKKTN